MKPFSPKPRTLSASVADAPRFCFFSGTRFTFALAVDLLLADVCSSWDELLLAAPPWFPVPALAVDLERMAATILST